MMLFAVTDDDDADDADDDDDGFIPIGKYPIISYRIDDAGRMTSHFEVPSID